MEKIIAHCGLVCSECEAYTATQKGDMELKKALAEKWSKEFNSEIKAEDINCMGCQAIEGPHISYCHECAIRKCSSGRKLKNCAYCDDFACDQLTKFFDMAPAAKTVICEIRDSLK